ncbi:ubiquitin-activating enzyme E1 [Enteropsectra breve]|nr:ubiquitin-activating enzyme E1 [Enteropsectra breve]
MGSEIQASDAANPEIGVDEDLYSRQLYVLGHDAMKKLMEIKILIIGMDGLGQEIAKNVCLAGIRHIDVYDKTLATTRDLGSSFYISKNDLNKPRDAAVLENLKSLNKYVSVRVVDKDAEPSKYDIVISVSQSLHYNLALNSVCREHNVKFIMGNVSGLSSQIFVDLIQYTCVDKNGHAPSSGIINDVTADGIVTLAEGSKHSLENDDTVRIDHRNYKVERISKTQFKLMGYESQQDDCKAGGDFEQIKEPFTIDFVGLEEAIERDDLVVSFGDEKHAYDLHAIYCGGISSNEHSEEFKKLKNRFEATKGCLIAPMCSIVGGYVAQEILKAASGKFTPLKQFFYFDEPYDAPHSEANSDDRYADISQIFGKDNFEKLQHLNVFLVGAGAIGCENLKNFVMCGIGAKGRISVTDMDDIEQSNLNRQFLFKEADVSQQKSASAVERVKSLNEDFCSTDSSNLVAYNSAVNNDTENIFSDHFFEKLDLVSNALDNVEAREYMDRRCVMHRKPMVDAGTLGTKGHVQVVLPHLTESYSSTVDAAETSVPMCTIKSHPTTIDHAIEWALQIFKTKFNEEIENINEFIETQEDKNEAKALYEDAPRDIKECIKVALGLFVELFSTKIQSLLASFPPDYVTKEGLPFWSPPKRPPVPISFNVNDKIHILFVETTANLLAECMHIRKIRRNEIFSYLENLLSLCEPSPIDFKDEPVELKDLNLLEFDKDSWHSDFVYACSNLRARNYKIKEQSKHFIKGIAGKIIPAIATTTAVVSGLATLEIIKYFLDSENAKENNSNSNNSNSNNSNEKNSNEKNANNKNAFLDLAMPFMVLADPVEAAKHKAFIDGEEKEHTLWDRVEIKDKNLGAIIQEVKERLGKTINMVSLKSKIVYWTYCKKYDDNLSKTIAELCDRREGQKIQYLDYVTDEEEEEEEPENIAIVF